MRKIFLDVGGHRGQTIEEISKPVYLFDTIHCFEPLPTNSGAISARFGQIKGLQIHTSGLSNKDALLTIFEGKAGDLGASTKRSGQPGEWIETECNFVEASRFFKENIEDDDFVLMKLNCEGAECDILNNLIDSGEISKIHNVMIDFDVRKFRGLESEEHKLLARFQSIGFSRYSLASKVMVGKTHQARIANWIRSVSGHENVRGAMSSSERLGYVATKLIYAVRRATKKLKNFLRNRR